MTDGVRLRRLTLPVTERSAKPVALWPADHVHRVPEIRSARLICNVLQHSRDLPAFHFVEHLAGELEIVPLVIDRPRAAILHDDAPVGGSHDVVETHLLVAGKERYVRHALELHGRP